MICSRPGPSTAARAALAAVLFALTAFAVSPEAPGPDLDLRGPPDLAAVEVGHVHFPIRCLHLFSVRPPVPVPADPQLVPDPGVVKCDLTAHLEPAPPRRRPFAEHTSTSPPC